ncbi:DUF4390 domain-containing protein [Desulfovibrio sp. OttesenSCG-928-A18]|nr:DUF4390 domain-containing protein [Desulfovibrio sp. OttesenSCG-928-A18]
MTQHAASMMSTTRFRTRNEGCFSPFFAAHFIPRALVRRKKPHKNRSELFFALVLACAMFLCFPSLFPAQAAAPSRLLIEPPRLLNQDELLYAQISLTVDDEDGLHDLLKDGAVLELKLTLRLERNRTLWANAEVAQVVYSSILRHDPLTRDFIVTLPGREARSLRDRNLTRLLHKSWRSLNLAITALDIVRAQGADNQFTFVLNVTLKHSEVPPWLDNSMGLWSSDVVPSGKLELPYSLP